MNLFPCLNSFPQIILEKYSLSQEQLVKLGLNHTGFAKHYTFGLVSLLENHIVENHSQQCNPIST